MNQEQQQLVASWLTDAQGYIHHTETRHYGLKIIDAVKEYVIGDDEAKESAIAKIDRVKVMYDKFLDSMR